MVRFVTSRSSDETVGLTPPPLPPRPPPQPPPPPLPTTTTTTATTSSSSSPSSSFLSSSQLSQRPLPPVPPSPPPLPPRPNPPPSLPPQLSLTSSSSSPTLSLSSSAKKRPSLPSIFLSLLLSSSSSSSSKSKPSKQPPRPSSFQRPSSVLSSSTSSLTTSSSTSPSSLKSKLTPQKPSDPPHVPPSTSTSLSASLSSSESKLTPEQSPSKSSSLTSSSTSTSPSKPRHPPPLAPPSLSPSSSALLPKPLPPLPPEALQPPPASPPPPPLLLNSPSPQPAPPPQSSSHASSLTSSNLLRPPSPPPPPASSPQPIPSASSASTSPASSILPIPPPLPPRPSSPQPVPSSSPSSSALSSPSPLTTSSSSLKSSDIHKPPSPQPPPPSLPGPMLLSPPAPESTSSRSSQTTSLPFSQFPSSETQPSSSQLSSPALLPKLRRRAAFRATLQSCQCAVTPLPSSPLPPPMSSWWWWSSSCWLWTSSDLCELDDVLEQFLATVSSKVKGRRPRGHKKVTAWRARRMRCGAPAVTRLSFSEDDLVRFARDNDGFPIAANAGEISEFDNEVFCEESRLTVGDSGDGVKRKSRSKSLSEVVALAKLLKLPHVPSPSKPKFLDRFITGSGVSSKKCSGPARDKKRDRRLLANQDSSVDRSDLSEDEAAELACSGDEDDDEGVAGYLRLLHETEKSYGTDDNADHHSLPSPEGSSCWGVLSADRHRCSGHATDTDCDAVSPPISPILSGLVRQRCERFSEPEAVVNSNLADRARSEHRRSVDSPHSRRCFSPVAEKADRLVKSFYSLSRNKNFSKAVMAKGYVRALAEQINIGALPKLQNDEDDDEGGGGEVGDELGSPGSEDSAGAASGGGNDGEKSEAGQVRDEKEEAANCACPTGETPSPLRKKGSGQRSHSPATPSDCQSSDLCQSPTPSESSDKKQCSSPTSTDKTVWSPRTRRKGSPETSPQATSPDKSQSPQMPKSSRVKPPVDYAHKPKIGASSHKAAQPANGDPTTPSSAQKKCSRSASCEGRSSRKLSSLRSQTRSSSQDKSPASQDRKSGSHCSPVGGVSKGEEGVGSAINSHLYDNVFFSSPRISPQELFDMSWSDTCSEFSDSETEEGTITAEQASTTCEALPSAPKDKLHQIALELLTTERTYVKHLSLLHQGFYFRIDQENRTHGFLPGDTLMQMFSSIQSIHQFHSDFLLKELEDRMKNWENDPRIGDLMKKFAPFLKLYAAYIKNFTNAMTLINYWLDKSPKFASIIKEVQKSPECGNLSLQHHMLGPVQRVPRYELLLNDYFKHLPEDSPDRQDAQDALNLVTKANCHSNEAKEKIEKFHRLLDIYQRLRGVAVDFICPTRDFVREGPITKISARSGEKQSRYAFLFNDLLLICSEQLVGAYKVRAQLDVEGMEVKQGDNLAIPNTFMVHSKQKAIELLDEQTSGSDIGWHDLLKQVIEDHRNRKGSLRSDSTCHSPTEGDSTPGKQAPRWIPDDAATMCMMCQQPFSTFRRRHHCRACGKLICKSCSKKAPLEYMNNKMERVCVSCHDAIVYGDKKSVQSPAGSDISPTKKRGVLQVKADDPGLLAGYLSISEDVGRSWNKRWFSLHTDFVMYFFKARQDVSAYNSLPLPGYAVETVSDADKPNTFRVHHRNINVKGILFQADNEKILKKWVNTLGKLVMAQLPDESQRLSSQSNSSATSSGSDSTTANNNNNNNATTPTNNSDKLSQADSSCTADSECGDTSVTSGSSCLIVDDGSVSERL